MGEKWQKAFLRHIMRDGLVLNNCPELLPIVTDEVAQVAWKRGLGPSDLWACDVLEFSCGWLALWREPGSRGINVALHSGLCAGHTARFADGHLPETLAEAYAPAVCAAALADKSVGPRQWDEREDQAFWLRYSAALKAQEDVNDARV